MGSSPVVAQEPAPALDLADGPAADHTVTVTLQPASFDAGLRIEDRSDKRLHVRIVTTPLRRTAGQVVTITWERHADGAPVGASGKPYEPLDLAGRAELVRASTYTGQVSLFSLERPNGPERRQRTIALTLNRELQTFDDLIMTPAPLLTATLIPFVGRDLALRSPCRPAAISRRRLLLDWMVSSWSSTRRRARSSPYPCSALCRGPERGSTSSVTATATSLLSRFRITICFDHEGPPCQVLRRPPAILVHYRTPTEAGNSGSPVFLETQWLAIALHRSGLEAGMYKLNGKPGKYSANEGIALSSISDALTGERGIELVFV